MNIPTKTLALLSCFQLVLLAQSKYTPDWQSLDSRPLPGWYDEAKFGVFMHWGLYSVPSLISEWFWRYWKDNNTEAVNYMKANFKPGFEYPDFGPMFTAELFNPTKFAETVAASGAKYYVLTSKHHEGYTMWPSKYSWNWNAKDVGPNKDLVGELAAAFRKTAPEVKFGLYYSLFEWFHPLYLSDKAAGFNKTEYRDSVYWPQLMEIINEYQPEVLWSDGDWEAPSTYWKSQQFLAWLYNSSPVKDTVVTNDRWGIGTACKHGGYYSCQDRYNPGKLQNHKWENAMTVDSKSWGFRRTAGIKDILTIQTLLKTFATTISCGGNMLMNVGPTHDGRIIPVFQERLLQMGQWLKVNGEAIYASKPWIYQNDTLNPDVWYTSKMLSTQLGGVRLPANRLFNPQVSGSTVVYAIVLKWPMNGQLTLGAPTASEKTKITLLGYEGKLVGKPLTKPVYEAGVMMGKTGQPNGKGIVVDLTYVQWWKLPNTWAWVLKLENLANSTRVPEIMLPSIN